MSKVLTFNKIKKDTNLQVMYSRESQAGVELITKNKVIKNDWRFYKFRRHGGRLISMLSESYSSKQKLIEGLHSEDEINKSFLTSAYEFFKTL